MNGQVLDTYVYPSYSAWDSRCHLTMPFKVYKQKTIFFFLGFHLAFKSPGFTWFYVCLVLFGFFLINLSTFTELLLPFLDVQEAVSVRIMSNLSTL